MAIWSVANFGHQSLGVQSYTNKQVVTLDIQQANLILNHNKLSEANL
jgi:hypothetical protein